METYIALLRGINVGGKNKVSMPILKKAFEEIGFLDVVTYINSGNVVFSSDINNLDELKKKCEKVIRNTFTLDIPVMVVSIADLESTLAHAPEWWNIDKESVNYAIFVISPTNVEDIYLEMGEARPEYEKIAHHENVIFWSGPLKTYTKTRYSKIASSKVNNKVTIRNANTVIKLLKLAK